MNEDVLSTMDYWITERLEILRKKTEHAPKPWSKDPIFQQFKFCNVHREDDYVTKWFAHHWRSERYWDEKNFIPAIMLGRTINWPNSLEAIGFPHEWNPVRIKGILDDLQKMGKVYTGAYMITAGPAGVSKNEWVLRNAETYFGNPPEVTCCSIQQTWETIINNKYPCVGPFIAGQIVADLKHTGHLDHAKDWYTWAPVGPGSTRGLNRLYDRPLNTSLRQDHALKEMLEVKSALGVSFCLQDVQNCLCELDKYMRVKLGQGKPRASYNGVSP